MFDLKYTIVTTLVSVDHVETCIYLCNISIHMMSFVKLRHWRYSVFVTSCVIHLMCAALTTVHTDLCMFLHNKLVAESTSVFPKKKKKAHIHPRTGHEGPDEE